MGIDDAIFRLAEVIKSSPEFSRLAQAKAVISRIPNLKRELEEFSLSQKQLYSGKLSQIEVELRIKQLDTKLDSLSKIPEVKNYFNALDDLNQIMIKINNDIKEYLEKSLK